MLVSHCLTSLSMIISRSIHVAKNASISFLLMANIPLCICTTSSWSTPLSMDMYVVSTSWVLKIVLQWTLYLFESWFSLDRCPGVGVLDQMVVLFLVFWEVSILFSTEVAPICNPTNSVIGFPFALLLSMCSITEYVRHTPFPALIIWRLFDMAILASVR